MTAVPVIIQLIGYIIISTVKSGQILQTVNAHISLSTQVPNTVMTAGVIECPIPRSAAPGIS